MVHQSHLVFKLYNCHKLLNSKWPLNSHFTIVVSQKLFRSLADIAEHICQIKKRSDGSILLKRAKKHFSIKPFILLKLVYGFFCQILLSEDKIKINGQRQIIFYFSNHKNGDSMHKVKLDFKNSLKLSCYGLIRYKTTSTNMVATFF